MKYDINFKRSLRMVPSVRHIKFFPEHHRLPRIPAEESLAKKFQNLKLQNTRGTIRIDR